MSVLQMMKPLNRPTAAPTAIAAIKPTASGKSKVYHASCCHNTGQSDTEPSERFDTAKDNNHGAYRLQDRLEASDEEMLKNILRVRKVLLVVGNTVENINIATKCNDNTNIVFKIFYNSIFRIWVAIILSPSLTLFRRQCHDAFWVTVS